MSEQPVSQPTNRHVEILRLVAQGLSNKEIGKQLYLSEDTVKTHLRRAFLRLGANTRTEAVMAALRLGLIEDPTSTPAPAYEGRERRTGPPGRRAADGRRTHPGPSRP